MSRAYSACTVETGFDLGEGALATGDAGFARGCAFRQSQETVGFSSRQWSLWPLM